ncbi:AraC family transcriptional regulator [Parapedobacter tibetensis]|uniref:AraC family transcriptional regulator n=1 Tax=Parapedobacter tibetensis TaxID=2972951 RepID=UPI00214DEAFC|nr:helix-turn-helix domain-containing protein [Parapedobacter tibetensis]
MVSFLLLACFQLLIFVFILLKFPLKEGSDRFLLLIAIGGTLALLSKLVFYQLDVNADNNLLYTISSTLCFAAMSHLFSVEVFTGKRSKVITIVLHLVPYGFSLCYFGYEVIRISGGPLMDLQEIRLVAAVENYMRTVSLLIYLALDLRLFILHRQAVQARYRTVNGSLSLYFTVHKLLLLLLIGVSMLNSVQVNGTILFLGLISMPVVVFAIMHYKIFVGMKAALEEKDGRQLDFLSRSNASKYAKSNPDDERYEEYKARILSYLEREKPFLDLDFSLQHLAEALDLSNHDVSITLNSRMDTTFYQLVNTARVEHFLQHSEAVLHGEKTILAAAYESGFNSKSTFNKYFKMVTGESPREFLKRRSMDDLRIS